jgi:hypothetical protein
MVSPSSSIVSKNSHKCERCSRYYKTPQTLRAHLNKCETVKCEGCDKQFPSAYHVNEHIMTGKCSIPPPSQPLFSKDESNTDNDNDNDNDNDKDKDNDEDKNHLTEEDKDNFDQYKQLQYIIMDVLDKLVSGEFVLLKNDQFLRYHFVKEDNPYEMNDMKDSKLK